MAANCLLLLPHPVRACSEDEQSRDVKKRNFSFFRGGAAGSVDPGDQHVVPALLADWFRGEAPADFCTVDDIEVHRCAFVFQLLQTNKGPHVHLQDDALCRKEAFVVVRNGRRG